MVYSIKSKWAVITGASDGIGRALVIELGNRGYSVLAIGRSSAKLEALRAEYKGQGELQVHTMNFSKSGSGDELQGLVADKSVEIFIPAAGFGSSGNFVDLNLETELEMVDVNCRAVVEQTQWFAQKFERQNRGTLILFSSLLGTAGSGTSAVYAATKNFIHAFAEGLRVELKPSGVKVLTICPGPTNSGFAQASQMSYSGADSAAEVAKGIANSIGKNGTIYPATRARFLGFTLSTVPRSVRVSILTSVMRGLQSHK
jgi:short-subunit dehydrogenase